MTNLALFITLHPELYDAIEEIVFMGGGVGIGNRSATAGKLHMVASIMRSTNNNLHFRVQCFVRS
jgi:hypothetical protein